MTGVGRRRLSQCGYSAIEMMFTLAIMGIIGSMALVQISTSRPAIQADGGMRVVLGQLNAAREMAITQRRFMRITFTTPNAITITREDTTTTTTQLSQVLLDGGSAFSLVAGVPDSPDAFGNSSSIAFGTVTNVKFAPDGTLVNQDGAVTNGSVFLSLAGMKQTARVVTVLGSTGRIRGYKWDGHLWKLG